MTREGPGTGPSLILGTAQFGLAYGVAGRAEAVPETEIRAILELAAAYAVPALDTAPGYGDIESRLWALSDGLPLKVISKIPPAPASGGEGAIRASIEESRRRLGDRLTTLLFHRADDLLRADGHRIWRTALDAAGGLRLGVSCYDPMTAVILRGRFGIDVAQIPANPLDQRLSNGGVAPALAGVEVHARSVFLQGLLLMEEHAAASKVPAAAVALHSWHAWCRGRAASPIAAALAVTRQLPGVRCCVVGVDHATQLREILEAPGVADLSGLETLRCDDPIVIDPRRWNAA